MAIGMIRGTVRSGAVVGRAVVAPPPVVAENARAPVVPIVDKWRLTRRLSSRGRFALFRACASGDLGPGCYVLKCIRGESADRSLARALLQREADVAQQIAHRNLNSVLATGLVEDAAYLVMPYCEGITLRRLLTSVRRPASICYALAICRQIAAALESMHAAAWLHSQVCPRHIIVSPQGHVTLLDLTQSRQLNGRECDTAGPALGLGGHSSLEYVAPESFASRGQLTAAADVYSLGVILFELLVGSRPFNATSRRELIAAHRCAAPPDLRQLRCNVSRDIAHVVRLMLAKEPLRRPGAEQVVRWLAELEIEELRIGLSNAEFRTQNSE